MCIHSGDEAMPLYLCVCREKKNIEKMLKNASSMVAKAFEDLMLYKKQSTESHWSVSVPDAVKAVLSPLYQLRTSYYRFLCSPLFEIACGIATVSNFGYPIREKNRSMEIDPGNVQRGARHKCSMNTL